MSKVLVSALVLALVSAGASASEIKEKGAFAGIAFHTTKIHSDVLDDDKQNGFTVDTKDKGIQLWGGYKFFKWFALEGRYAYLGKYESQGTGVVAGITDELEQSALTGNAVFMLPFGNSGFEIYGQAGLGIIHWESSSNTGNKADGREPAITGGGGVRWTPASQVTLSLGVDGYRYAVEEQNTRDNLTIVTPKLGVQINF